jgi:hypothetical protein
MFKAAPRFLLALASILLVAGSILHALAFPRAVAAIGASNLPIFFGNILKVFWLADSTTMLFLAALFALIAARPAVASRTVVVLLAAVPAGLAVLIYIFMGAFFAGHILTVVATAVLWASWLSAQPEPRPAVG